MLILINNPGVKEEITRENRKYLDLNKIKKKYIKLCECS